MAKSHRDKRALRHLETVRLDARGWQGQQDDIYHLLIRRPPHAHEPSSAARYSMSLLPNYPQTMSEQKVFFCSFKARLGLSSSYSQCDVVRVLAGAELTCVPNLSSEQTESAVASLVDTLGRHKPSRVITFVIFLVQKHVLVGGHALHPFVHAGVVLNSV